GTRFRKTSCPDRSSAISSVLVPPRSIPILERMLSLIIFNKIRHGHEPERETRIRTSQSQDRVAQGGRFSQIDACRKEPRPRRLEKGKHRPGTCACHSAAASRRTARGDPRSTQTRLRHRMEEDLHRRSAKKVAALVISYSGPGKQPNPPCTAR